MVHLLDSYMPLRVALLPVSKNEQSKKLQKKEKENCSLWLALMDKKVSEETTNSWPLNASTPHTAQCTI